MKLQRAKLTVIALTLAGVLFVAGACLWLLLPALTEVRSLAGQIVDAQTELEAQYANRRNLLDSIDEVARVREVIEVLSSQFIPDKQELTFITAVEEAAAKRGAVERVRLSVGAAPPLEELSRSFELTLTGPFRSVLETYLDIERLPYLLIVDAVAINANQSEDPLGGVPPVSFLIRGALAAPPKSL
jgi:Tfp pilus assembly protein PilO